MTFADGLRLVQRRGEAMQAAADATPSGMVSVLALEQAKVEELCASRPAEWDSADRQSSLSRQQRGFRPSQRPATRLEPLVAEAGGRTVRLAVAGAFHTPLMKPADEALAEVFAAVPLQPPRVPVWSNVTAQPHTDPEEIRDAAACGR